MDRTRIEKKIVSLLESGVDTSGERIEYVTEDVVEAADALIDYRLTFTRRDGKADLTGTTYAYRSALGEMMSEANIPPDVRVKVATNLRYHIGNRLRERFSSEELEDYGLGDTTPREVSSLAQRHRSSMWSMMLGEGEPEDGDAALDTLRGAVNLLKAVNKTRLSAAQRRTAAVLAEQIIAEAKPLKG